MSIATGTYVGNGTRQQIDVGFRPEFVITCPATAQHCGIKIDDLWCGRSNVLSATDSYISGAKLVDDGFAVGSNGRWNANGVTYHYLALARSSAFRMAFAGLQGNGQNGRVVSLDDATVTPAAVIAKRDSPRDGVLQVGASTTALLGGTALTASGAITALTLGGFTVSSSVYVNEYVPTNELGEGIDFIAIEAGANVATAAYTGTGATQTVALPFQPKAVIIAKLSGTVINGRIKTDTMGANEAKAVGSGQALVPYGTTFVTGGVELSAASDLNVSGASYALIAFKAHTQTPIAAPAVKRSGRKIVELPGRTSGSHVDCGVDDSLVIDGALTLEWIGSVEPLGRSNPISMLWRGNATTNTALSCSFALYANGFVGSPGNWSGPLLAVGCSDRLDLSTASTQIRSSWRTGLILPFGELTMLHAVHDGLGGVNLYKNGRLTRQRVLDLVADGSGLPNIDGQAGHRMMIGAMRNASVSVNNLQRQRFGSARIYNRALTAAEVADRFARAGLGSAVADVTSGLVEEWDAANASGTSLPATVNAANNGTITNGLIVTL